LPKNEWHYQGCRKAKDALKNEAEIDNKLAALAFDAVKGYRVH